MNDSYPLSDVTLARRLERCEASANAAFAESRARMSPVVGATWIERAGAYAMYDGVGSPLTQTFGLGIFETPGAEDLDAIEQFFRERDAEVFHEVSPISGPETMQLLVDRGYRPVELSTVLYRPIGAVSAESGRVTARPIDASEIALYSATAGEGWREFGVADFVRDIGAISASSKGMTAFIAELDGRAIGTGAVGLYEGVAIFAGASTIPEARKQGAQRALLQTRLAYAAEQGCDLAMMAAAPGSASQRNAERQGFRIAYTRIKWGLERRRLAG